MRKEFVGVGIALGVIAMGLIVIVWHQLYFQEITNLVAK